MAETPDTANNSRVAKNTTYLTVALIAQKVLSFLYVLILARLVGQTAYGDYSSTLSFVMLYTVFIDIGLTPALIRQLARDPAAGRDSFSYVVTFKIVSGVFVAAALWTTIFFLDQFGKNHPSFTFVNFGLAIMLLDSLTLTLYGYFRGVQRLEYESFGTVLHRLVVMAVGISGLVLTRQPRMAMIALVAGSLANFLNAIFQLWRRGIFWRPRLDWTRLKPLLLTALPFGVAGLFTAIYSSSDNVLLNFFHGNRAVGIYGLAYKITIAFQLVPSALVAAIFPAMSASFVSNRERLESIFTRSMQYLMIVVVPISVILFTLAEPIIHIGWTKVWANAVLPLRILSVGLPFLFLNFPVGYLLNAANLQTRNTINIAIVVGLNITANILFIRELSYRSVAIISVISSALLFFLGLRYVGRVITIRFRTLAATLLRTLLAGALLAGLGWWLLQSAHRRSDFMLIGLAMVGAYLILVFGLRILTRKDLVFFLSHLRRT